MSDFEILKELILSYNGYVCREHNEIEQIPMPYDERYRELYELLMDGVTAFKQKSNSENILFGQLGLGLFALQQGDFVGINPYAQDSSMVAETISYFNRFISSMTKTTKEVQMLSRAVQDGDFTLKVDDDGWQGDMRGLVDEINSLCAQINVMLVDSYQNGLELAKSANTLKNSTSTISSATTSQAAALEETSAALEELTDRVRNNMQYTQSMSQAAVDTTAYTNESKKLADDTADAIGQVGRATDEIMQAVKIIESIASQTNILSLNAAIEATRAGVAGRGFAVVAVEVRKLAARSAEAASQIRELAQTAKAKSDDGLSISNKMVCGLDVLGVKMVETTQMIARVSTVSSEQMNGIAQINEAIAQLDKATQENSHMVEETDDIAENVATLANKLVSDADSKQFVGKEECLS